MSRHKSREGGVIITQKCVVTKDSIKETVVDTARLLRTHSEHKKMVDKGIMWQRIGQSIPFDLEKPIEMLSRRNIRILKEKIGCLTKEENMFLKNIFLQPWFLTYFVSTENAFNYIQNVDGTVHLKSFDKRKLDNPGSFVQTNAASVDIEQFAGTNFVYLYLEIGSTLKKTQTRSGGSIIIRTIFNQRPIKHAMSMHGDIFDGLQVGHRMKIPEDDRMSLNDHLSKFEKDPLNDNNGFARTVFYTPDAIKEGTALQIILDARHLSKDVRNEVLTRQDSCDLNDIVSSMSRTQIMIPDECVLSNYNVYRAT